MLKILAYHAARTLGLFAIARRITVRRLRVLAYHGFASGDELQFRPKLFVSAKTFERRLALLKRRGFKVLALDDAVRQLRADRPPRDAVVITIDDGYASTRRCAAPLLAKYAFPATVYVTSYHVKTQTPVFDLVVGYMLWKTTLPRASVVMPGGAPPIELLLSGDRDRARALDAVIALGRAAQSEAERVVLCQILGRALGVPYEGILADDAFRLMTPQDLRELSQFGVSVGLHTHRHRFPASDLNDCRRELRDNEEYLASIIELQGRHFCYPSGVYSQGQWPLLDELRISSSTTCDTGLVRAGDPLHGLRRFLDGEMVRDVEFDAEVCGFADLLRQLFRGNRGSRSA